MSKLLVLFGHSRSQFSKVQPVMCSRNEDFVVVLEATVSALCWPWAFRRELSTINRKLRGDCGYPCRDIKGEALGKLAAATAGI